MRRFLTALVCAAPLTLAAQAPTEATGYPWPDTVVSVEQLPPITPLVLKVPHLRPRGTVRQAATLRVHVGSDGAVRRAVLLDSCGSPAHDEAALHAIREARFRPLRIDGEPVDATLVIPFHIPLTTRKRGFGEPL